MCDLLRQTAAWLLRKSCLKPLGSGSQEAMRQANLGPKPIDPQRARVGKQLDGFEHFLENCRSCEAERDQAEPARHCFLLVQPLWVSLLPPLVASRKVANVGTNNVGKEHQQTNSAPASSRVQTLPPEQPSLGLWAWKFEVFGKQQPITPANCTCS